MDVKDRQQKGKDCVHRFEAGRRKDERPHLPQRAYRGGKDTTGYRQVLSACTNCRGAEVCRKRTQKRKCRHHGGTMMGGTRKYSSIMDKRTQKYFYHEKHEIREQRNRLI